MSSTTAPTASFWEEAAQYWKRLPDKSIFFILLGGWVALFQFYGLSSQIWTKDFSLFTRLWGLYGVPDIDESFAYFMPAVILGLLWLKREKVGASLSGTRWPGLGLLMVSLILHIVGFFTQLETISTMGLFLGFYALIGLTWGSNAMKATFFPMVLLGFCVPLGSIAQALTIHLRLLSTNVTALISRDLLSIGLTREGNILTLPSGLTLDVAPACSGLHSLSALAVITTIFAVLVLRSPWRRATLIIATAPLAVICNVLRLVGIVIAFQAFGQGAGHLVHEWDWVITFGLAITTVMALAHWLGKKEIPVTA